MRWRPINTAPKDDHEVLITNGIDIWQALYVKEDTDGDKDFWTCDVIGRSCEHCWDHQKIHDATHWMPLPKTPEGY